MSATSFTVCAVLTRDATVSDRKDTKLLKLAPQPLLRVAANGCAENVTARCIRQPEISSTYSLPVCSLVPSRPCGPEIPFGQQMNGFSVSTSAP